jgi:hypothetical protein
MVEGLVNVAVFLVSYGLQNSRHWFPFDPSQRCFFCVKFA